jgi:cAMP phosphodiesterase
MEIMMLPSTTGSGKGQPLSTYVINDRLAVDAGALGLYGTLEEQVRITDIVITHSHLDHVAGLALLVDNVYDPAPGCVTVHGCAPVLDSLQRDIFNGRVYPDMIAMSKKMSPFLKVSEFQPRQTFTVAGCQITGIPVNHVVPTVAFIIDDGTAAIAIVTDTAPTEEIWHAVAANPRIQAVFLECAFPNSQAAVAQAAMHLTPRLFAEELRKIPPQLPVIAVHLKPRFYDELVRELTALGSARLSIGESGRIYRFIC